MKTTSKKSMPKASLGSIIKTGAKLLKNSSKAKRVSKAAKKVKKALTPDAGGYNPFKSKAQRRKDNLKDAALLTGYSSIPAYLAYSSLKSKKKPVAKQVLDRAKKASKKK